jgi:hypothetical protein
VEVAVTKTILVALAALAVFAQVPSASAYAPHRCPRYFSPYAGGYPGFIHVATNTRCATVRGIERHVARYWASHHRFPHRVYVARHWWRLRYARLINRDGEPYLRMRATWRTRWARASLVS